MRPPPSPPAAGPGAADPGRRAALARWLRRHEELLLYAAAAVAYIVLGIAVKQALAWMIEAAIFLWLTVWLLPDLVRWLWRRRR